MDHQAPIDLEILASCRIDLPRGIGGEEQRLLKAVIAGLGQLLSWALDAAGGASRREQAAKAAQVAFSAEAVGGMLEETIGGSLRS